MDRVQRIHLGDDLNVEFVEQAFKGEMVRGHQGISHRPMSQVTLVAIFREAKALGSSFDLNGGFIVAAAHHDIPAIDIEVQVDDPECLLFVDMMKGFPIERLGEQKSEDQNGQGDQNGNGHKQPFFGAGCDRF